MRRLAICGWDDETPDILRALERYAGLLPAAIGDTRASHLVRARAETGLPCYQHVHEMLRSAEYDAVLLGASGALVDPAHTREAAEHGAMLLLRGGHTRGEALATAAQEALTHGTPLAVLRPLLRAAGVSFITDLVRAEPAWRPTYVSIDVRATDDPVALLRDTVGLAARLVDATPSQVALSLAGAAPLEPGALAAHLRYPGGALIQCAAHRSVQSGQHVALTIEAPAGSIVVQSTPEHSRIMIATPTEAPQSSTLTEPDANDAEARRIGGGIGADDARFAHREAAIMRALEGSLETGYVHPVVSPDLRAALRVLPDSGRGANAATGTGHGDGPSAEAITPAARETTPTRLHLVP